MISNTKWLLGPMVGLFFVVALALAACSEDESTAPPQPTPTTSPTTSTAPPETELTPGETSASAAVHLTVGTEFDGSPGDDFTTILAQQIPSGVLTAQAGMCLNLTTGRSIRVLDKAELLGDRVTYSVELILLDAHDCPSALVADSSSQATTIATDGDGDEMILTVSGTTTTLADGSERQAEQHEMVFIPRSTLER